MCFYCSLKPSGNDGFWAPKKLLLFPTKKVGQKLGWSYHSCVRPWKAPEKRSTAKLPNFLFARKGHFLSHEKRNIPVETHQLKLTGCSDLCGDSMSCGTIPGGLGGILKASLQILSDQSFKIKTHYIQNIQFFSIFLKTSRK